MDSTNGQHKKTEPKLSAEERLQHSQDYGKKCIREEAQALLDLIPQIDDNFERAVSAIYYEFV